MLVPYFFLGPAVAPTFLILEPPLVTVVGVFPHVSSAPTEGFFYPDQFLSTWVSRFNYEKSL